MTKTKTTTNAFRPQKAKRRRPQMALINGFSFALHCHCTDYERIPLLIRMAIFYSKNLFSLFSFLFFSVLMQNKNDLPSEYNSFQKKMI